MPQLSKITVNLYKLARLTDYADLPGLLHQITAMPLRDRSRTVASHSVRLEHVIPPLAGGNPSPYWLLDFVKLRMSHGPGKAGVDTPIEGFALNNNEGFGEETAALFDPQTNHILVQYNHSGVRGPSIERYFNSFQDDLALFELHIKLDQNSEARLANKQFITKVSVKIARNQMTAAHRANNVSLGRALSLSDEQGGDTVQFTLAAEKGRCLSAAPVRAFVDSLRSLRQADLDTNTQALTQFSVEAKAELTDRADKIDMLMPALRAQIDGVELGLDRRYTLPSRWQALARARHGWHDIINR